MLTSVGLDHTEWLGESEEAIAAEKLAVLRDHSALVLGRVRPAIAALARETAGEHGAKLIVAPEDPGAEVRLRVPGDFQRRNFALACAAAEAFLGELDRERAAAVAATLEIPGRLETIDGDPPAVLDAAHNPDGAAALAEALPEIARGRPAIACLAILADKDAPAMIRALAPALAHVVCTELPSAADGPISRHIGGKSAHRRGFEAAGLARICAEAGVASEAEADFDDAVARGRQLAREAGGILLVAGSHYALTPARVALGLCED